MGHETDTTAYDAIREQQERNFKASSSIKGRKVKKFRKIVKDSYNTLYGIDRSGTLWRLDRLDFKGIEYTVN